MHYRVTARRHAALRRIAQQYDWCRVQDLVDIAIDELIAAHKPAKRTKPQRRRVIERRKARRRRPTVLAPMPVEAPPTTADEHAGASPPPCEADHLETVWDGTAGRQGVPIPRH